MAFSKLNANLLKALFICYLIFINKFKHKKTREKIFSRDFILSKT